jgi:hypothetical protein
MCINVTDITINIADLTGVFKNTVFIPVSLSQHNRNKNINLIILSLANNSKVSKQKV